MPQYASVEDWYDFRGLEYPPTPALTDAQIQSLNAELEQASDIVADMLRLASYAVDTDGLPVGANRKNAIVRATCAQLAWTQRNSPDSEESWTSVELIGVKFSRPASAASSQPADESEYAPAARRILRTAGLFRSAVRSA